jgi:glycosyltransferase involved in cell wall biosynthesis
MVKKLNIGLTFSYNEEWIAGSYYILNIIHSLNTLPSADKPWITILSDSVANFDIVKKETRYPYLKFFKTPLEAPHYSKFERLINKIGLTIFKKKPINKTPKLAPIDVIYPFQIDNITSKPVPKLNWVPDFQEYHLPHLFSSEILAQREKHNSTVISNGDWVVFSSLDAQQDFQKYFPNATAEQFVLPFAVTHPSFEDQDKLQLREKYQLPENYFFAPNQFWAHKNHLVVLKALKKVLEKNIPIHIAFTGREDDHRNKEYIKTIKTFIKKQKLENNMSILGFIPREEQLKLMKESIAIIQPSKFEGWSTVVEDAKALNKYIVLSNLAVHKEQIEYNASFFAPDNEDTLSEILADLIKVHPVVEANNYSENIKLFAKNFMSLAYKITTP